MKHGKAALAIGAMILLHQVSNAAIIKVYDPNGSRDFEAMASAVETLKQRHMTETGDVGDAGLVGEIEGFDYRIVPGRLVTPEFSLTPGSSAYFWSSTSYKYQPGFSFTGGSAVFRANVAITAPEALGKEASEPTPIAYATALGSAKMVGGNLLLRYSLAQPAAVSLQIVDVSGKLVGKWSWRDGAAGFQARLIDARLSQGVYLLDWSSGNLRMTKRLMYDGGH